MTVNTITPKTQYGRRAQEAARELGLRSAVYPYLEILDSVNSPDYLDKIKRCAEVVGTDLNEQLKFIFANSSGGYTPTIGVVCYTDKMDFKKLGELLVATKKFPQLKVNNLSSRNADPRKIGIDPYFIGINQMARYPVKRVDVFENDYTDYEDVPYVFDNRIRKRKKICCPVGKGKADELFVLESDSPLGERNVIDTFLERIIGKEAVLFGDIRKFLEER